MKQDWVPFLWVFSVYCLKKLSTANKSLKLDKTRCTEYGTEIKYGDLAPNGVPALLCSYDT